MSHGPIFLWQLIYQAKTQPVPVKEDVARLEWTVIWDEPVRQDLSGTLAAHLQQSLAFVKAAPFSGAAPGTGTLLWHMPWSAVMSQPFMIAVG